jgi:glutaminyl-peptide cyclotransferase
VSGAIRHATAALTLLAVAALPAAAEPAPRLEWRVVAAHPHDRQAFTQGLLMHDGVLYESTGLRGRSTLRAVDPGSGRVLREHRLAPDLFGEGLARVGDHLYQLTWQAGRGFVYALPDLRLLGDFTYPGEGWGLAADGDVLYMSDGSDRLRVIEARSFAERRRIAVRDDGAPVARLNELELIDGVLLANVWRTDRIARIDPGSGRVTGWLDLSGLLGPLAGPGVDVLNGIAWDPRARRLWVTGKLWPRVFVLEVHGL